MPGNSHFFAMLKDCGAVCRTSPPADDDPDVQVKPGKYFDSIRKKLDCSTIWKSEHMDVEQETAHPPRLEDLPAELVDAYTFGGRVAISKYHFDQRYYGSVAAVHQWTPELVETEGKGKGTYGMRDVECLRSGMKAVGMQGKSVLVIGSERPWVEASCLLQGAASVTTLEYGAINSTHPKITALTPATMHQMALDNKLPVFDVVVSFSSVEHSGLGRYGDALNPWGDLITMARAWCATKDDGKLVYGTMTAADLAEPGRGSTAGGDPGAVNEKTHPHAGHDFIRFNADRNYGHTMYPHLMANWEQQEELCGPQRVFTFKRMPPL